MNKTIIFFMLFFSKICFGQIEIGWKDLEDIEFSETFIDSLDEYILFPNFGPEVLELSGKKVAISGYILEIDIGYYILSKGPFASCFFCGAGGPETIAELSLKSDDISFVMDEFVTIVGVLKLNDEDIYRCNYILEYAYPK